jgi:hypothetical protein
MPISIACDDDSDRPIRLQSRVAHPISTDPSAPVQPTMPNLAVRRVVPPTGVSHRSDMRRATRHQPSLGRRFHDDRAVRSHHGRPHARWYLPNPLSPNPLSPNPLSLERFATVSEHHRHRHHPNQHRNRSVARRLDSPPYSQGHRPCPNVRPSPAVCKHSRRQDRNDWAI